ncbi:MAG: HypC/HybG/HupF family hydrogenase formation chaperone [Candidatus Omnitrophota bacterium]
MCLAVPARIKGIEGDIALVDFGGVTRKISLGIIGDARLGDYVLVHAGFAIGKVGREEAEDTLKLLRELSDASREDGIG